MDETALREAICEVGRRLDARNLVAATDGNISARIGDDRYLCTPSGVAKGYMRPEQIVIADSRGDKVSGEGKVTSEFFTHLAVYEEREDVMAVVHAHPPSATACTFAGVSMTAPALPELVMALGGVPVAPYATPGSREGGEVIRPFVRKGDAVLLDRHGAVTAGTSPLEAYLKMEKIEHAADLLLRIKQLGDVPLLDASQLARIQEAGVAYGVKGPLYPIDEPAAEARSPAAERLDEF